MDEIVIGSRVVYREDELDGLLTDFRKKVERREGVVENIYMRHGANMESYRVRWLKRGNRGKEFTEHHQRRDLRLA